MQTFSSANLRHNFDADSILYLVGDVNYCFVHTDDGKQILASRTLKWFSKLWPTFIRPHKGSLVNPKHVLRCIVISHKCGYLLMRNGSRLPIGRRRIKEVVYLLQEQTASDPSCTNMNEELDKS